MVRRPYTTKVRPFKDSDEEVDLVWYPCLPGAPTLGFPSRIQSLDWSAEPWRAEGVGEVWDAPRKFNRKRPVPAATGEHVCGTEAMFREGEDRDPEKPATVYRPDGLPTCCFQGAGPPVRVAGGIGGMPAIVSEGSVSPVGADLYLWVAEGTGGGYLTRTGPRSWVLPNGSSLTTDGAGFWTLTATMNPPPPLQWTISGWTGWTLANAWVPVGSAFPQYQYVAPVL